MTEFRAETVEKCLVRLSFPTAAKLQEQDYQASGLYPVVDQGQTLIAGWTDDKSGLISTDLPVVVFGDHTRALKYIDFPFVRGADGTQILKPKAGIEPLYFYYACRAIDLPSRGYNRHFKELKQKEIQIPSVEQQRDIAMALKLVDDARSFQDEQLIATETAKRAATQALFTRGLRNEAEKDTEIGPLPQTWGVSECEEVAHTITVGVVVKPASHYVEKGVPAFRSLNVKEDRIDASSLVYFSTSDNDEVLSKSKLKAGDVLVVRTGYPGTSCVVPEQFDGANCIDLVIVKPRQDVMTSDFLSRFLNSESGKRQALSNSHGLAQQHLNVGAVRRLKLPVPPTLEEQRSIVAILATIDRKIDLHRQKRAVLDELFNGLLHNLMTGEIRVGDLDLSALEPGEVRAGVA
jgi:type I restriction enzyme S subunit